VMTNRHPRGLADTPLSRRTLLRFAVLSGGAGLAAWLTACGGVGGGTAVGGATGGAASGSPVASVGTPKRGGTLRAGLTSDVGNLDPLLSSFLVDRQVFYNMYESLVAIDTDLKIIPSLAEKWDISADGKAYTFSLRQGVKFHDGSDFNADAVKFNIERYLNDKTSRRRSEIDSIQAVEVVDPNTVRFTLKAAFAPLLANLVDRAGMMLSPQAVQAGGPDFTRKPVGAGTGPFKFVEWVKDDHITLERNTAYWKKAADGSALPYLDKITYRPITDETVRLTNLRSGDLDVDFAVPAKDYATVKSGGEFGFQETTAVSFSSLYFNTATEPFNKKELRQALAYLIDRDQISKTVFFGTQKIAYGPVPPSSWAYDSAFTPYSVDVAKAKSLLQAGGKPDGFTFEFKVGAGSPTKIQLAQLLKDQFAKANITMNIAQLEAAKIATDTQQGNFQSAFYGWSGRIDPDGNIYNQMRGSGSLNESRYDNAQVNDLLDKARASTMQTERTSLYQQAQRLIVEDAPFIFYGFGLALLIGRTPVQGTKVYADQIMRFERVWLQ